MRRFLADAFTYPTNREHVSAIKTAIAYGVPPTVMILLDKQPSDGWSVIDKKLAIAYQILQDETCPECGIPTWIGHTDSSDVRFKVRAQTCYSCAEIEAERETVERKRSGKNARKETKGKKRYVGLDDNVHKHPSRDSYYREQAGILDE